VLDVVVLGAGLVARDPRRERASGFGPVDDGEDDQRDADDGGKDGDPAVPHVV
jgi:hypothetical protein